MTISKFSRQSLVLNATAIVLSFGVASAFAAPFALSPDGATVVRITPQGTVSGSTLDTTLLNTGWTGTVGAGGSASVTSYDARYSGGIGGARFTALYDHGSALGAGESLEWIQVLETNVPLGGATSPYLDNAGKPSQPFYTFTAENRDPALPDNQLNFYDFSKRNPSNLATTDPNPITWNASLYPVVWDGGTQVTVQDGLSWGWTMDKATVGSVSATFTNPSPSSAIVTGVGTDTFTWGTGTPGVLSFAGAAFDTEPGTPFTLGRLTYSNGTTFGGEARNIDLNLALAFDNIPEKNIVLSKNLSIVNTTNTSDPIASADFVTIDDFGFTFNVLEGATAAVDLIATLTTSVVPVASGAVPTGAELASLNQFDPDPIFQLSLVGFRNPSQGGFIGALPEPSSFLLAALAGSIVVAVGAARRRKPRNW